MKYQELITCCVLFFCKHVNLISWSNQLTALHKIYQDCTSLKKLCAIVTSIREGTDNGTFEGTCVGMLSDGILDGNIQGHHGCHTKSLMTLVAYILKSIETKMEKVEYSSFFFSLLMQQQVFWFAKWMVSWCWLHIFWLLLSLAGQFMLFFITENAPCFLLCKLSYVWIDFCCAMSIKSWAGT